MNTEALESKNVRWVLLGAVVGIGNFFTTPDELARIGGFAYLFWHLISLVFLCAPLVCAELMWGKWLRRPLHESFEIVHPRLKSLSILVLLALGVAFPPYIYAFSVFLIKALLFFVNASSATTVYLQTENYLYLPYIGALILAALAIFCLSLSRSVFARLVRVLVAIGFLAGLWVAFEVVRQWGWASHLQLLQKGLRDSNLSDFFRVSNFSFFSVALCCSIFYVLIQWMPKTRIEEGGLVKLSFFLVLGDFAASLLCFFIVSPFIRPALPVGPHDMYLDWIPHSLIYLEGGYFALALLYLSLFSFGFCTIAVVFWVCADHLEAGLNQTRQKTLQSLAWWSMVALFLPIIPKLRLEMAALALKVLMPLSALVFALAVGIRMPRRSQHMMLGRGFVLDSLVRFWRLSMFFLVIPYLVVELILNFI